MKYAEMIQADFFVQSDLLSMDGLAVHVPANGYKVYDLITGERITTIQHHYGEDAPEELQSCFFIQLNDGTTQTKDLDESVPLDVYTVSVMHAGIF